MLRKFMHWACVTALMAPLASATTTYTYQASGTAGGNAVDALGIFTLNPGSLTIQLTNLLPNPGNIAQNISQFQFGLVNVFTPITGGLLTSSSGLERTVNGDGSFFDGSTVATGWAYTAASGGNGNSYFLDDLSGAGPQHTLIGPGPYTSANASIAGNGPHNPFLANTITFNLSIASIDPKATTVDFAKFFFGTTAGAVSMDGACVDCGGTSQAAVPEPVSMVLVGSGLVSVYLLRRRKKRPADQ